MEQPVKDQEALIAAAVPVGGLGGSATWSVREYSKLEILTGDSVAFVYAPYHDVMLLPDKAAFDACDFSGAELWAEEAHGDPGYVHKFEAEGTYYLACSVASHCLRGQKVEVVVKDTWRGAGSWAESEAATPAEPVEQVETAGGSMVPVIAGVGGVVALLGAYAAYRSCSGPSKYNNNTAGTWKENKNNAPTLADEAAEPLDRSRKGKSERK